MGLHATNEPKSAERENKPDYIIRKGAVIIGFVEAKDIDKDLKAILKTAQLKRYLEALPNLILTNYIDFIWFVGGEKRMEASLASLNGKAIKPAQDANARWQELIDSFCKKVAPRVQRHHNWQNVSLGKPGCCETCPRNSWGLETLIWWIRNKAFAACWCPTSSPKSSLTSTRRLPLTRSAACQLPAARQQHGGKAAL